MTDVGTSRCYRPDPSSIGVPETWGRANATATLTADSIIVTVSGELDACNAVSLTTYLERHAAVTTRLYVDLRNVTFFATAGLAVVRRVDHLFVRSGRRWWLLAGPAVRKVLRICGAQDLPQVENLDRALRRPEHAALLPVGRH